MSEERKGISLDLASHLKLHHEPRIRSTCRRRSGTRHQSAPARVADRLTLVAKPVNGPGQSATGRLACHGTEFQPHYQFESLINIREK